MGRWGRSISLAATLAAAVALALPAAGSAAAPKTITIEADTPLVDNCWPLGSYLGGGGPWGPNFAFVYKNIPAFQLKTGDTFAFDMGSVGDTPYQSDIAMVHTTANGNDVNDGPFTTIVDNTQLPTNPTGNTTSGDYEMAWVVQHPFSFPGGGLLIRLSNVSATFASDGTCTGDIVGASDSADSSGFFVRRDFKDTDGVSPWDNGDSGPIGDFRLVLQPVNGTLKLGRTTRNRHKGTAQIEVDVSGPGALALSGQGVKAKTASGPSAQTSVSAAGTVKLTVKPKGKARRKLNDSGKARVNVKITFTPSGDPAGDPVSQSAKIKLVKNG